MNDYALYIGRFQPFHHGHLASVKYALSLAKSVIMILGGSQLAPSFTDPWTATERKKMILSALNPKERKRVHFIFIRDRLYNEELWKENLIREVQLITKTDSKIVIIGHVKDATSYYLKIFPQWPFVETGNFYGLHSTSFRQRYFSNSRLSYSDVPNSTAHFLKNFRKGKLFKHLRQEYAFSLKIPAPSLQSYILLFVGDYLLLTKRSAFPGKNLYSLPTSRILFPDATYAKYFVAKQTFHAPKYDGANQNGKEVFFYRIPLNVPFDIVKYAASKNLWVLFDDFCLMENRMFADYYQIIRTLLISPPAGLSAA